jgi:hypothetical protein
LNGGCYEADDTISGLAVSHHRISVELSKG